MTVLLIIHLLVSVGFILKLKVKSTQPKMFNNSTCMQMIGFSDLFYFNSTSGEFCSGWLYFMARGL